MCTFGIYVGHYITPLLYAQPNAEPDKGNIRGKQWSEDNV
jgi:hypothetical protein